MALFVLLAIMLAAIVALAVMLADTLRHPDYV